MEPLECGKKTRQQRKTKLAIPQTFSGDSLTIRGLKMGQVTLLPVITASFQASLRA